MGLRSIIKAVIKRSVFLTCVGYLVDDWWRGHKLRHGRVETSSGTTHQELDLEHSVQYIELVYRLYLEAGGIDGFRGQICEIGPGDNLGVALLILKGGADEVYAIDRYYSKREDRTQRQIYQALSHRHGLDHLFSGSPDERNIRGVHYISGQPAERFFHESNLCFDAIVSCAVLEHLFNPIAALDAMLEALDPGGLMIHRIDFRDHGMFPNHRALTFLTIPERIFLRMVRNSGRPNRVLYPAYRDWLERSGLSGSLKINYLVGTDTELEPGDWEELDARLRERACEMVRQIRPSLSPPLATMADEELAIASCILVGRKPD